MSIPNLSGFIAACVLHPSYLKICLLEAIVLNLIIKVLPILGFLLGKLPSRACSACSTKAMCIVRTWPFLYTCICTMDATAGVGDCCGHMGNFHYWGQEGNTALSQKGYSNSNTSTSQGKNLECMCIVQVKPPVSLWHLTYMMQVVYLWRMQWNPSLLCL